MRSMPEAFAPDGDDIPDAAAAMAPGHFLRLGEWRTVGEYVAARLSNNAMSRWPRGDGHPVLVIPGFLAGGLSTQLLRDVLETLLDRGAESDVAEAEAASSSYLRMLVAQSM